MELKEEAEEKLQQIKESINDYKKLEEAIEKVVKSENPIMLDLNIYALEHEIITYLYFIHDIKKEIKIARQMLEDAEVLKDFKPLTINLSSCLKKIMEEEKE